MSWKDTLQDASFKGVKFDVVRTTDAAARDLAEHEYPYLNGADVEDLGRKAWSRDLTAVFWGNDYDTRLKQFLKVLDQPGPGELIHPVFGSIAKAQLRHYKVEHDAETPDHCTVELSFVEDTTSNPFFVQQLPAQKAQAVSALTGTARASGIAALGSALDALKSVKGNLARLNALRGVLTGTLGAIRNQVKGIIGTTLDLINYPQAFAADVVSCLSGMADLRSFNIGTILADWKSLSSQLASTVQLPHEASTGTLPSYGNGLGAVLVTTTTGSASGSTGSGSSSGSSASSGSTGSGGASSSGGTAGSGGTSSSGGSGSSTSGGASSGGGASTGGSASTGSGTGSGSASGSNTSTVVTNPATPLAPAYSNPADVAMVTAFLHLAVATQLADTAAGILADEADDPTLTPAEIEQIANDTRSALQTTMDQVRQQLPTEQARAITEPLKDIALAIQTAAISVIDQRPPLVQRTVTVPGNLHLTAFRWYGDYTRADELARLNPQITNPNFLTAGETLNAYAS